VDYIIEGRKKLEGEVTISGSKNASLPILAASILNGKKTALYNVPNIHDTQITRKILELLGCKTVKKGNKIVVDSGRRIRQGNTGRADEPDEVFSYTCRSNYREI